MVGFEGFEVGCDELWRFGFDLHMAFSHKGWINSDSSLVRVCDWNLLETGSNLSF